MDDTRDQLLFSKIESPSRALFEGTAAASLLLDEAGFFDCNRAALQLFKSPSREAIFRQHPRDLSPSLQPSGRDSFSLANEYIAKAFKYDTQKFEWLHKRFDNTEFPAQVVLNAVLLNGKKIIEATVIDISLLKQAEQELRIAAITFELHEGILVTDNQGAIIRVNHAFSQISGYSVEELTGKTPEFFRSGRHDKSFYRAMWSALTARGFWQGEIWNRHKDGDLYTQWLTISSVREPEGQISHYIGIYSDIPQHGEAEAAIYQYAYYDALTNLPNRRLLLDRTEQAMIACKRTSFYGAIIYLDLDNFKSLNDTRGHGVGDKLLIEVARRLQVAVREGDTIARIGGDEFVILLENLSQVSSTAIHQVQLITEKLLESIAASYDLQEIVFACSSSFGVRLFNQQDHSVDDVLKQADLAMYEAKRAGGNSVCFFKPQMQTSLNKRTQMQSDLYDAIKDLQLSLYYQIQINHEQGVEGVEALLRWQHPSQGLVLPGMFVALAEESDLTFLLGFWVLETVCRQLEMWQSDPFMTKLTIAVNVSARQFSQAGFVAQIKRLLTAYGVSPHRLKLELTENLLLADANDVISKMNELKELGIQFSMDNFGAGYLSLSHLKQLPLSQLKIDRSFIENITTDAGDAAIAKTIIDTANNLHLNVIAEGVETQAQADLLKQLGCYCYQGYLYGKPLTLDAFEGLLKHYR